MERTTKSNHSRLLAGILSFLIPGTGQMYKGEGNKGALIVVAAIVIGNLNIIILPLISMANPVAPPPYDERALWAYWIPRIMHDVLVVWTFAFWFWAVRDAASGKIKPSSLI